MKDTYFENQVAVVTGAGGTLCSAIAVDLARLGAKIALIGRTEEKLQKTAREIEFLGGVYGIYPGDVTDEARMKEIANQVERELGPCRLLINGAGGNQMKAMTNDVYFQPDELKDTPDAPAGFFNLDVKIIESVLSINTIGSLVPIRVFARQMLANGRQGAILNFASMNSYRPLTKVPAYAMSKAAVVNMTQWLATYFGPTGIRINAVAPGFFVNERSVKYLGSPETGLTPRGEKVISHTPMQRFGQPEDLLGCVRFLLDDRAAAFVTGITVPVDGGFLSHPGI